METHGEHGDTDLWKNVSPLKFSTIFHSISGLLYLQGIEDTSWVPKGGKAALLFGYTFNIEGNL